jgi:hypothetical protein
VARFGIALRWSIDEVQEQGDRLKDNVIDLPSPP